MLNNKKPNMVYHSKKDWWLVVAVWSGILLVLAIGIFNLVMANGNIQMGWTLIFVSVFTSALVLLLTYPLYYEITSSSLIVRCGLVVRKEIPLSSIIEAHESKSPKSAPAWSLDRLQIDYSNNGEISTVLISPPDKLRFMRELASTDAGLTVRGERLVRVS